MTIKSTCILPLPPPSLSLSLKVLRVSSVTNEGVAEAWETMNEYRETLMAS